MIGPVSVKPTLASMSSLPVASIEIDSDGLRSRAAVSWPGVMYAKTLPSNSLPPVSVATLTTPPVARPYSAL